MGYLVLEGLVDIAAAAVAVFWPGITVVAFVFLIAFWAIFTGLLELVAAFRLQFIDGRGWLIFGGIVSVLYGALLIIAPMIGAVVLTWWLGAYALVLRIFGVAYTTLSRQPIKGYCEVLVPFIVLVCAPARTTQAITPRAGVWL